MRLGSMNSYNDREKSYFSHYLMAGLVAIVVGYVIIIFFSLAKILFLLAWEHKVLILVFIGAFILIKHFFGKKKLQRREYEDPYR